MNGPPRDRTDQVEAPPGYVLVPRGGRPPKHARHFAVYLARLHYTEILKKKVLADEELCKQFELAEASVVRTMVKKAARLAQRGVSFRLETGLSVWVEGSLDRQAGRLVPLPLPGGSAWAWAPGMQEALKMRVATPSNLHV